MNCSVEHVILNVACSLEDEDTVNVEKYCLRVWGLAEYFAPNTTLAQYEYIHLCIKLEKDIELAIITRAQIKQSIARTVSIMRIRYTLLQRIAANCLNHSFAFSFPAAR